MMKIVYNRFIPFGRFTALTVLVWLFVKEGVALTARLLNHEKIHMRQQLEIVAVCLLGTVAAHLLFGVSAWWMLAAVPAPLLIYGLSVAIEVLLPPYNRAYGTVVLKPRRSTTSTIPSIPVDGGGICSRGSPTSLTANIHTSHLKNDRR